MILRSWMRWCGVAIANVVLATSAYAQAPSPPMAPLELTKLAAPIVVDGRPEAAWDAVPALPLTMYSPVFRGTASQQTVIRVAYDAENLYAAAWLRESDPSNIRVNSLYRDRLSGDDLFALYIDAFNDNNNAKWFGTTPAGVRIDQAISDDGATQNENWDGFWSAAASIDGEGWFAEMKIPFSTLGFQPGADGRAVMGLTAIRLIARNDERVTFPAIDPGFPFRRPSLAADVVVRDVRSSTPVYVTPYALLGSARNFALSPDRSRWARTSSTPKEVGVDVRYPISGLLTLDVTANTDFAQAEADGQQVALDRFPLFFPERRRFFQENSGLFDFNTAGGARVFHSRRIGLTPGGLPVRILGGARLVGRAGAWDLGALNMQTDGTDSTDPENVGVFRLRRRVLNSSSSAGAILTSYLSEGRRSATVGADTTLRVKGNDYLTFKGASSFDESGATSFVDRSLVDAVWERRTGRGLQYQWQVGRSGPDYRPRLGFQPRSNVTTANTYGNWFIFTDKSKYFRRIYPGWLAFSTLRNTDRALESGQYAVWVQWDTKTGGGGWVEPKWFHENVLTAFTIGGTVTIPSGAYDFADLQVNYSTSAGRRVRTSVDVRAGSYFDGRRAQVIVSPTWSVSRNLDLGGSYQLTHLTFPVRAQHADIHLASLRVRVALDSRASASALCQYNSTTRRFDANLRLRYAVSEGTDLWIVYNEGLDASSETQRAGLPISSPRSLARTLIVKYNVTVAR